MNQTECPLVIVRWRDSRQPASAWQYLRDLEEPKPVECASVGWLLKDDKDAKLICPNMGDVESQNPQGTGMIAIPASCIISIERLEEITSSSRRTAPCSVAA